MRKLVEDTGHDDWIEIESAGTEAYHEGELPDDRSRRAARRRGIQLDSLARPFAASDFERLDYVLAMDRENLDRLEEMRPARGFDGHLGLLLAFDSLAPPLAEVPDPYYGGPRGFDHVLDLCQAACGGLLDRILGEHTGR